jgi:hypothetical protein
MKTFIHSLTGKYFVNILMTAIFTALAISGLFNGGGGSHHSRSGFRAEQFIGRGERFSLPEQGNSRKDFYLQDFRPAHREKQMDFHTIAGLLWLFLMFLHIWQHWNWFKRVFSFQHIRNNKLLSFTILVFVLLSFTGMSLAFHLIPRGLFNVKEIHELMGQLLGILVVIHCIQRYKWIISTTRNLINRKKWAVTNA